jgi:hypothetical protein
MLGVGNLFFNKLISNNPWILGFSRYNSWFMVANKKLIMVGINYFYFFNFLAFKIHYKNKR